jgi:hypothetical protein
MSEDLFNTPREELLRLADEIRETKELLRDVSGRMSRIETRMKRSFPTLFPKAPLAETSHAQPEGQGQPTLTPEQVMGVYEELVDQGRRGELQPVRQRLAEIGVADLNLMRRELGASLGTKKPSRRSLEEAVIGRIRESVMLSKHTHRSELIQEGGTEATEEDDPEKP